MRLPSRILATLTILALAAGGLWFARPQSQDADADGPATAALPATGAATDSHIALSAAHSPATGAETDTHPIPPAAHSSKTDAATAAHPPKTDAATHPAPTSPAARPALTVTLVRPEWRDWPRTQAATGNLAAWQEVSIGPEIGGYRLTEVQVEVGDRVRAGQPLVRIASETLAAELAQARAEVAEAEARVAEARADADRARQLQGTVALSAQQSNQYLTAEQTALARLAAARARVETGELRLSQTLVTAPDDGLISARAATLGALAQPGQELLRLIRGGRLEWQAEVPATELHRLAIGGGATIFAPDGTRLKGRIRQIAPTVDPRTLTGLVYVDLPVDEAGAGAGAVARAGMFVRGELELGRAPALTLPQSAILVREGLAQAFLLEPDQRVAQTRVRVDRRIGDRVEILDGLDADSLAVASGVGFLTDGDTVRVVDDNAAASRP